MGFITAPHSGIRAALPQIIKQCLDG